KIHLARYSPRPGTVSAHRMEDDVPDEEKRRRFHIIEQLHKEINEKRNKGYLGTAQEVLVEELYKGRWRGRNPQGKLVFFDDPRQLKGELVNVKIEVAGPWSMSGTAVDKPAEVVAPAVDSIPLSLI
ncbi:MAG: TRAM domain-containing protein, partial [Chloroflexota bacterium]